MRFIRALVAVFVVAETACGGSGGGTTSAGGSGGGSTSTSDGSTSSSSSGGGGEMCSTDPGCDKCAAFLTKPPPYAFCCGTSTMLVDALQKCVCEGACKTQCDLNCNGGSGMSSCSSCLQMPDPNGCATELDACMADQ